MKGRTGRGRVRALSQPWRADILATVHLPDAFSLAGRVALVTGAGSPRCIGLAVARLLGDLGASVAVAATTDRAQDRAAELATVGVRAIGVVAELTDEEQVVRAVRDVERELGAPTVNKAGMTSVTTDGEPESGDVLDLGPTAWRYAVARNLDTAYPTTRAVLPHMISERWVASSWSPRRPDP
jgi:3-oxoacyl-[acyl-carrier protein] reductase